MKSHILIPTSVSRWNRQAGPVCPPYFLVLASGDQVEPRMDQVQTYSKPRKYGSGICLSLAFDLLRQLEEGRPRPG